MCDPILFHMLYETYSNTEDTLKEASVSQLDKDIDQLICDYPEDAKALGLSPKRKHV